MVLLAAASWVVGARAGDPAEVFRFGTAEIGARLTHAFPLRNPGGEGLEIQDAVPSCDCIQVVSQPVRVEAGTTGTVEIAFTPDRIGTVDYRVFVHAASPDRSEIEFAIQGEVQGAARTERDGTLYLEPEKMAAMLRNPEEAAWVDVRSQEAHERAHVPGAIPLPLFAVKTKGYLKNRRVVLMDEGWGSPALETECRKLRSMGFADLWIWPGGLQAWRQLGGSVEGAADAGFDRLPPEAVSAVEGAADWRVVSAEGGDHGLAGAWVIPFATGGEAEFAAALGAALAKSPEVVSVLIATEQGFHYDRLAPALARLDVIPYYLEGGWSAWKAHRKLTDALPGRQAIVARSETAGGKPPRGGGCGGCPP